MAFANTWSEAATRTPQKLALVLLLKLQMLLLQLKLPLVMVIVLMLEQEQVSAVSHAWLLLTTSHYH